MIIRFDRIMGNLGIRHGGLSMGIFINLSYIEDSPQKQQAVELSNSNAYAVE